MNFKKTFYQIATLLFCCIWFSSLADEVTIVFDNAPPANLGCYDTWVQDGFTFQILPESVNDNCGFFISGYCLSISSVVIMDVSGLGLINQITIDGTDTCNFNDDIEFLDNGTVVDVLEVYFPNNLYYYNNLNNYNIEFLRFNPCDGFCVNSITIKYTPTETCQPQNLVNARSGDFYVDESCHGVIFTAPDGTCYRVKVGNGGALVSEEVSCP